MNYKNTYEGIDTGVVKAVKRTARRAIGKRGLKQDDLSDIEQELMMKTIKALGKYDHIRGTRAALAWTVAKHSLAGIYKRRQLLKNDWRKQGMSLNKELQDSGDVYELIELVATDGTLGNPCMEVLAPARGFNLKIDIDEALKTMPHELRQLCEDLKLMRASEVAQKHNMSKQRLHRRIKKIRKFIEPFNLRDRF